MFAVLAVTVFYAFFIWIVFFKFKWLRLTPTWGVLTLFVFLHLVLVPLVGMRFVAPFSEDVRLVRPTIQIVPRLPEPTLVEKILVEEGKPVKKGDPLFVFDKRLYQFQVDEARAVLESARQNVVILEADVNVAKEGVTRAEAELGYRQIQEARFDRLAAQSAAPKEEAQKWTAEVVTGQAEVAEAKAKLVRAQAAYGAQIDGVNTQVLEAEAQLSQALYYLDQTVIYAPEDGSIVNLQVQGGMVAGIVRVGAIASFIADRDPYVLAMYRQENLRFVRPGQDALVALNLYAGQPLAAKVKDIRWASGRGQFLPSGELPVFLDSPEYPEARLAVELEITDKTRRLPIGAEGAALILTNAKSPFAWVGQVALRTYTWSRWLYPLPF